MSPPSPLPGDQTRKDTIDQMKLTFKETIGMYMNLKGDTEKDLNRLLETDPDAANSTLYAYDCEVVDRIQLHVCALEAVIALVEEWSTDVGNHEVDETVKICNSAYNISESVRDAVGGMKMEVWKKGEEECPICLEDLRLVRVTPCLHHFHGWCLFRWLYRSTCKSNPKCCPKCRSILIR